MNGVGGYGCEYGHIRQEKIYKNGLLFLRTGAIISLLRLSNADVAQSVERILGKDEVTGSNPVISSEKKPSCRASFFRVPGKTEHGQQKKPA